MDNFASDCINLTITIFLNYLNENTSIRKGNMKNINLKMTEIFGFFRKNMSRLSLTNKLES